ncbi:MAG TPA: hypothetical protein PKH58_06895 [Paludibacteraceae bacterium]|nr:hypothetical protein [Paludibacteraceae bacterium]HPT43761.1 hypothetical protein [Paludibacteraceae bacterium]
MIISLNNEKKPAKAVYYGNEGHTIHTRSNVPIKRLFIDNDKNAEAPFFRLVYK